MIHCGAAGSETWAAPRAAGRTIAWRGEVTSLLGAWGGAARKWAWAWTQRTSWSTAGAGPVWPGTARWAAPWGDVGGAVLTGFCMAAAGAAWLGVARVVATATVVTVSIAAAAAAGSIGKVTARRAAAVVVMLDAPRGWRVAVIWKPWGGVAAPSLAGCAWPAVAVAGSERIQVAVVSAARLGPWVSCRGTWAAPGAAIGERWAAEGAVPWLVRL